MKYRLCLNDNIKLMHIIIVLTFLSMVFINRGLYIVSSIMYFGFIMLSIILSPKYIVYFIAFLSPINRVFLLNSTDLTLIPILIAIAVVKFIIKYKKINLKFIMLFIILFVINFANAYILQSNIINVFYYFIYLFFSYIVGENNDQELYINVAKYFIIGTLISCFGGEFFPNIANMVQDYRYLEYGFYRYMGLLKDSTEFGQKVVVAIAFTVSLMNLGYFKKYISILIIITLTYFLILSGTRSTLIGMIVIILYLIYKYTKNKKNKSIVSIIGIFFIIPVSLILFYNFVLLPMIGLRSGSSEVFLIDRFKIWNFYYSIFINEIRIFLFGIGAGNTLYYSNNINYVSLHNGFLETIFEFGIIGSIFLLILIKKFYLKGVRLINDSTLPLIVYLSTILSLGITRSEIPFILLAICNYKKINEKFDNKIHLIK